MRNKKNLVVPVCAALEAPHLDLFQVFMGKGQRSWPWLNLFRWFNVVSIKLAHTRLVILRRTQRVSDKNKITSA